MTKQSARKGRETETPETTDPEHDPAPRPARGRGHLKLVD